MVILCLIYWGIIKWVSSVAGFHFVFPLVNRRVPTPTHPLSEASAPPVILCLSYSHPSGSEVVSYYGFHFHFSDDYWCCASFHLSVGHLYIFGKTAVSTQALHLFLKLGCFSFYCCVVKVFYKVWDCSVAQSCPALCDPMDCGTPGFPVLHHV